MQTGLDTIPNRAITEERIKWRWQQICDYYGITMDDLGEFVFRMLQRYETVVNLKEHFEKELRQRDPEFKIARDTIDRFAEAEGLQHYQCWRRVKPYINGTFNVSIKIPPIEDAEGERQ